MEAGERVSEIIARLMETAGSVKRGIRGYCRDALSVSNNILGRNAARGCVQRGGGRPWVTQPPTSVDGLLLDLMMVGWEGSSICTVTLAIHPLPCLHLLLRHWGDTSNLHQARG